MYVCVCVWMMAQDMAGRIVSGVATAVAVPLSVRPARLSARRRAALGGGGGDGSEDGTDTESSTVASPNSTAVALPVSAQPPPEAVRGPWNGHWLLLSYGAWGLKGLVRDVLGALLADPLSEPFRAPVDHVALGLHDYLRCVWLALAVVCLLLR
jgi:hypothetical protein